MVVQNGIVENFLELKDELTAEGIEFQSDTDTETIVHLVEHYIASGLDLVEAARQTFQQIQGANVVVLMSADEPDKIVAARIGNAGGVVLGLGKDENFLASDIPAIMEHTHRVMFLESRQMAVIDARSHPRGNHRRRADQTASAYRFMGPGHRGKRRVSPLHAERNPRAGAGH